MDFTPFLRIKPDVEKALTTVDLEVTVAKEILDVAQRNYDQLTTEAGNLRLVLAMLINVEKQGQAPPTQ